MDDYWTDFVQESEENITELNNSLLELERSPDDEAAMERIFRTAHTLKGNCAAMGLEPASDLAHAIEDLLDEIRAGEVAVSSDLMDVVFDAVDDLEAMIDEVADHGEIRTDPTPTVAALRAHVDGGGGPPSIEPPTDDEIDAVLERFEPPADEDHDAYYVRLAIDESDGDVADGVLVVEALIDAFDLLGTEPPRETIEDGSYDGTLDAVFGSAVGEAAIAAALEPVDAVADFEIDSVTDRIEPENSSGGVDPVDGPGTDLSPDRAQEMSTDELLEEFDEFDDLDDLVEDVDDVSAFDDMGEAGSFDDLLDAEDVADPDLGGGVDEPDDEAEGSADADGSEPTADDPDGDDEDDVEDANAVFNELKEEVDMVGFDELQDELADLEFDEFDDEVGMDELLGDDVEDDGAFLDGDLEGDVDDVLYEDAAFETESEDPDDGSEDAGADEIASVDDGSWIADAADDSDAGDELTYDDADLEDGAEVGPETGADADPADEASDDETAGETDGDVTADTDAIADPVDYPADPTDDSAAVDATEESTASGDGDDEPADDSSSDADESGSSGPIALGPASDDADISDAADDDKSQGDPQPLEAGTADDATIDDEPADADESTGDDEAPDGLDPDVTEPTNAAVDGLDSSDAEAGGSEVTDIDADALETADEDGADDDVGAIDDAGGAEEVGAADDAEPAVEVRSTEDVASTDDGDYAFNSSSFDSGDASVEPDDLVDDGLEIDDAEFTGDLDLSDDADGFEASDADDFEEDFGSGVFDGDDFSDDDFEADFGTDDFDESDGEFSVPTETFDASAGSVDGFDASADPAEGDDADRAEGGTESAPTDATAESSSPSEDGATAPDEGATFPQDDGDTTATEDYGDAAVSEADSPPRPRTTADDVVGSARDRPEAPELEHQVDEIQSIRVDVDQVDNLLNMVEGLVTSRVRLRHAIESGADRSTIADELDDLEEITTELQETVMDVRLVPLQTVANRLPRVVRDIAREQEKDVVFEMTGEDVELDRTILDQIGDPLIHLVRNAVDHGIEPPAEREATDKPPEGTVELRAERSRDRVTIEVEDDGRGLDPDDLRSAGVEAGILSAEEAASLPDEEAFELIFHPGLSTAEEVTDVSGRGVGMDVVKRTIDDLDGSVSVSSELGTGTTVTMTLPVTVAIGDVLFVESGGEEFGVPIKAVRDIDDAGLIETVDGRRVVSSGDEELPVVDLATELDAPEVSRTDDGGDGVVVRIREDVRPVALHCDDVLDQQEVVIKPFEGFMGDIPGLSGATVRGRGEVVNILDVETL